MAVVVARGELGLDRAGGQIDALAADHPADVDRRKAVLTKREIVEGDPSTIKRQRDVWTFGRVMGSDDPNWQLVATGE